MKYIGMTLVLLLGCSCATTNRSWDDAVKKADSPKDVARMVSDKMLLSDHVKYLSATTGQEAYALGGGRCEQLQMASLAMCKAAGIDAWKIHIQPKKYYEWNGQLFTNKFPRAAHVATFGLVNEDGLCWMIENGNYHDFYGGYPWVQGWYASQHHYAEDLVVVYE